MSMHARLGAESVLSVLDDHLVTMICDLFCRQSKASSLLDGGDAEEEGMEGWQGGCDMAREVVKKRKFVEKAARWHIDEEHVG